MVIFNRLGWLMLAIPIFLAFGITWLFGIESYDDSTEFLIGTPIAALIDVAYRNRTEKGWFHPHRGGHFFFLPVWLWGVGIFVALAIAKLSGSE